MAIAPPTGPDPPARRRLARRVVRARRWAARHRLRLSVGFAIAVVLIAFAALAAILKDLSWAEVAQALRSISVRQLSLALALTVASYLSLTFYDVLALQAIGRPLPWWRAALGSFSAYCFSHNFGFAPVTGAAARWRAYAGTGLTPADIARIVVIAGVTFWLGIFLMFGLFLVQVPGALRWHDATLPQPIQAALGLGVLGVLAAYLVACARRTGPLRILGWSLPVPTLPQALAQFGLAALDISLAAAALLALLPGDPWAQFGAFLVAYVIAMIVALLSHAPGGLGVFEAAILVSLPQVGRADLVSALIVYRLLYHWLPLLAAVLLLGGREALRFRATPFSPDQGGGG